MVIGICSQLPFATSAQNPFNESGIVRKCIITIEQYTTLTVEPRKKFSFAAAVFSINNTPILTARHWVVVVVLVVQESSLQCPIYDGNISSVYDYHCTPT